MKREIAEEAIPICHVVANQTYGRYRGYVDHSDLVQSAYEWVLKHPDKTNEYLADPDVKRGSAKLASALGNELRREGERQKASHLGYKYSDLYWYSVGQIEEELLPAIFNPDAWVSSTKDITGPQGGPLPSEKGNWTAMLADVAEAYRDLPEPLRLTVEHVYRHGRLQEETAEVMEVSQSTVSRRLEDAIKKIHFKLGGNRPRGCGGECECTGSRRVISNSTAQAVTSKEYE